MKRFISILFMAVLMVLPLFGKGISDNITESFKKGDVELLSDFLNAKTEFIKDATPTQKLTKEQLKKELNSFFKINKPVSFTAHKGEKENTGFITGTLDCGKKKYRINILLHKSTDFLISQIRINTINE